VPDEFLAENFYLDFSREYRKKECEEIFSQAGEIKGIAELIPENQLRGTFEFITEKGKIRVFFTLTPEKEAKLQELDLRFEPTGGV
ncbi:MAG: serine hydrolase, partial [Lutimonas sp.]